MLITVAIAFVLLNGLGVWQLYRLHWKEGLIADLARTESLAPVPVDSLLSPNSETEFGKRDCAPRPLARKACVASERQNKDWRSVTLPSCTISPDRLVNMHSEMDGTPGYRVLTSCPLASGPNLLIDLGFAVDKVTLSAPQTIAPVGRLRPADKVGAFTPVNIPASGEWYSRSVTEIGKVWSQPLRGDYFLVLDVAASKLAVPGIQQGPVTAPLPNRHFEYALTWFGLAWVMIGIFVAFVRQKQTQAQM